VSLNFLTGEIMTMNEDLKMAAIISTTIMFIVLVVGIYFIVTPKICEKYEWAVGVNGVVYKKYSETFLCDCEGEM
jgi:hypothetical protein